MAYDFHYTPTGTGVISGKEVLEQTEDAINDLGNTAISGVQEALDKAEQALTNSENAVDDAQTALNTANNAEGVAIQAQTDVGNLSGTVTNIGNRVTTAEGNISNLQGRMTTAEGNITNLQGRMTTAESNIGNLQTAVSTAQATANSAQQTATTARQQSYVFRYSGTAITDNSTIAYSTIDNTDNIKTGDKILDVDGKLFEITAVDTANQTVTVSSALIDLALDGNVVHTSGNETSTGFKQFANIRATNSIKGINLAGTTTDLNNCYSDFNFENKGGNIQYYYCNLDSDTTNIINLPEVKAFFLTSITTRLISNSLYVKQILINSNSKTFTRYCNNSTWSSWVNETDSEYVHKSGNETIGGQKTFTNNIILQNSDTSGSARGYFSKSQIAVLGDAVGDSTKYIFVDKNNNEICYIRQRKLTNSNTDMSFCVNNIDNDNNSISAEINFVIDRNNDPRISPSVTDSISLGRPTFRWKSIYSNSYYYGNVEFSTKFVTTDTAQTISGNKTFASINGVEPSSLSLPVAPSSTSYVDISGYITVLDSSSANTYTPPSNGYITFAVTGNLVQILHDYGLQGKWSVQAGNANRGFIPVLGGVEVKIYITASNVDKFWFIPCQGNV